METFIITFVNDADKKIITSAGGVVLKKFKYLPNMLVAELPSESVSFLKSNKQILHVEKDIEDEELFLREESSQPNDDLYSHELLKINDFWERGITGKGIKVAVMDSGCQPHKDLDVAGGYNAREPDKPYMVDTSGHGTHVAGIIKSKRTGLAPDVDLYIIKLNLQDGGGFSVSAQIDAINWCLENNIDIVNYSGGGNDFHHGRHLAFKQAVDKGLIVISSAGNNQGKKSPFLDTMTYPAREKSIIAVGALDRNLRRRNASACGYNLNFIAPGQDILSTTIDPDNEISGAYEKKSGTSMASPAVASMFALYKQALDDYSSKDLVDSMIYNARNLGPAVEYGKGLPQPPYELYQRFIMPKKLVHKGLGIIVFDKEMRKIGILENSYNISVERSVNEVWMASFSLPADDPKNNLCRHFNFIAIYSPSGHYYGMYRIIPKETRKAIRTYRITYRLEHVLATLLDDVMDGYHQFTNFKTSEVIKRILELQTIKHWVFVGSEIERYFHYKFENENGLLGPILSVPKLFDEPYMFSFNTQVYPFELSLVKSTDDVVGEIRWGKDMVDFEEVSDPSNIVNYIIPKGAGEGVNQLDIKDVNDGKNYLKDDESIVKWGVHKYIWIDRRFTDKRSLKESAKALLDQWKEPKISFKTKSINLSFLPAYEHERKKLNGLINIFVEHEVHKARIIREKISDLNKEWDVEYEINNKLNDIATTQTDLQRKQQINEAYSQGATNILNFTYQDNCDQNIPAVIPFYIDDDVVNINTIELTFRTKPFRAYSRATEGGGGVAKSTSSGGGVSTTSGSGGGVVKTTASGGGSVQSSGQSDGWEVSLIPYVTDGPFGATETHRHGVTIDMADFNHWHKVEIPAHKHEFEVPNHTHTIKIENHSHEIELPNHTHAVKHEINELNTLPTSVIIKVDGNTVPHTSTSGDRINLVDYLEKDSNGKIRRGRHEVIITPNGLGRIEADLILRVFIQSQIGGVY